MSTIPAIHQARVGRSLGRTLYAQAGTWPDKADRLLGLFDTIEAAQIAAAALNGEPRPGIRWRAIGRLIFPITNPITLDDFFGAMTTREVATVVVAAVNGIRHG